LSDSRICIRIAALFADNPRKTMLSNQAGDGKRSSLHGHWSSRMAFILAVTGSAVGLGNIWKFPYIAGQNGGGAFVLVYLACVIFIGMPVMMSEILIGRRGRRNPIAIIVPCHRVTSASGVGGYAGKTDGPPLVRKQWLLRHESRQRDLKTA